LRPYLLVFFILVAPLIYSLEIPVLDGPVIDKAGVLSSKELMKLENTLRNYYGKGLMQGQILILPSLEGEILEELTIKITDQMKLGSEQKDNGWLFLVALKDRKMRLEVGQGLEGVITDIKANQIIEYLKPHFRSSQYYEGLFHLVEMTAQLAKGETQIMPKATAPARVSRTLAMFITMLAFIIVIILRFILGGASSHMGRSYQSRHGWGSGSSSGGFGSTFGGSWGGGGGGFSGGGSSGNW